MEHVGLYTITLVFTDDTSIDYYVVCWGLDGVFEEADRHFLATHADDHVELSHLVITNQEGVVIARWEGVRAAI
jgi:hypothetical protein